MSSVSIQSSLAVTFSQVGTGILSTTSVPKTLSLASVLQTSGVLADECDTLHMKTYTFTASTPIPIDLTSLTDIFGNAISFARVRLIAFRNLATTDGWVLTVGAAVSTPWTGFLNATGTTPIFPSSTINSGFTVFAAPNTTGMPVTGSSKILQMNPGANTFSCDVYIAGASV